MDAAKERLDASPTQHDMDQVHRKLENFVSKNDYSTF